MRRQAYFAELLRDLLSTNDQMENARRAYDQLPACSRLVEVRDATFKYECALDDLMMAARAFL